MHEGGSEALNPNCRERKEIPQRTQKIEFKDIAFVYFAPSLLA